MRQLPILQAEALPASPPVEASNLAVPKARSQLKPLSLPGFTMPAEIFAPVDQEAYIEHVCRLLNDGRSEEDAALIPVWYYARKHPEQYPLRVVYEIGAPLHEEKQKDMRERWLK